MKFTRFSLLSLVFPFISAPVGALDLTGTWTGKFNCSNFDGFKFNTVDKQQILKISQFGKKISVEWVGVANFTGFVVDDLKKPDSKGQAAIADCLTTSDLTAGFAEMAKLNASGVNRSKGKGSLKGTSIYSLPVPPETVGQCNWTFKLSSPVDPGVGASCP